MKNILLFFPFLFILFPYFGVQFGKISFYSFVIIVSMISTFIVFYYKKYLIFPEKLFLLFIIPIILMSFSILHSITIHEKVAFTDLIEIYRPLSVLIFLSYGIILYQKFKSIDNFNLILFRLLVVVVIFNFLITFLPFIRVEPFWEWSNYFGLSPVYHKGYAAYRAYGLAGQPGVEAILINILFILLLYFYEIFKEKKYRLILLFLFIINFLSLISTGSRIGLVFFVFNLIIFSIFTKKSRYLLFVLILFSLVFYICFFEEINLIIKLYTRGIDISSGQTGTLAYRVHYKVLIADLLSNRLDKLLLGIGPSKDFLQNSLRNPDSSISVYNIRFGYLGMFIYIIPQLLILFLSFKLYFFKKTLFAYQERIFIFSIMVLYLYLFLVANLDPAFDDIKLNILNYTLVGIFFSLYFEKFKKGIIR